MFSRKWLKNSDFQQKKQSKRPAFKAGIREKCRKWHTFRHFSLIFTVLVNFALFLGETWALRNSKNSENSENQWCQKCHFVQKPYPILEGKVKMTLFVKTTTFRHHEMDTFRHHHWHHNWHHNWHRGHHKPLSNQAQLRNLCFWRKSLFWWCQKCVSFWDPQKLTLLLKIPT